ncbi:hypothetical protein, partial [Streptomyces sp. NPDC023588]|uniref:hypothetical protein n=1 Tax=Streptomyces sp. NPDC023588 TaxID=3154907 RepID=UPI0033FE1328
MTWHQDMGSHEPVLAPADRPTPGDGRTPSRRVDRPRAAQLPCAALAAYEEPQARALGFGAVQASSLTSSSVVSSSPSRPQAGSFARA